LAAELIEYRKAIKSPLRQFGFDRLITTLSRAPEIGWKPEEALGEMQEAGWRGLKLSWLERRMSVEGANHGKNGNSRKLSVVERAERAYLEHADEPIDYGIGAGIGEH
jgi:hypothetical protein